MTDEQRTPYSPPESTADHPPSHLGPTPGPQLISPSLGASFLWLFSFLILFFVAAMLYVIGYGAVLGAEYAAQGISVPPQAEMEDIINAHIFSPSGIAGVYLTQFLVIVPAVLFAAHFAHQPWQQTLALHRFPVAVLKYWFAIVLVFIAVEYVLDNIMEIDYGDLLKLINGSQHFLLAVVISLLAPILEEFIFRGYLFTAWRHTRLGLSGTLLLTSVIFTGLHMSQYDGVLLFLLFIFSIILGLAREKSGSVWVPVILHGTNNFISAITVVYLGWL